MFVVPLVWNVPLLDIEDKFSIIIVYVENNYLIAIISIFGVGVCNPKHIPLWIAVEGRNIKIKIDVV